LINIIPNKSSVLEIGCGNGEVAVSCAKRGANIKALDISKNMIDNAKRLAKENNIENILFIQKDFQDFEIEDKFDFVILCYFLNVFPDEKSIENVFEKIKGLLKPNGHLLIADELQPQNFILSKLVNLLRYPVFYYFQIKAGVEHHKIHDLPKILKKKGYELVDEKRFLFQYCSVIIAKV
jgi:ubiquinone/menaquinone biosynthesis C-methylase UbiE